MRASEQETVNAPTVLYTGSNRSAKRDQALSLQELNLICREARYKPNMFRPGQQYFQDRIV